MKESNLLILVVITYIFLQSPFYIIRYEYMRRIHMLSDLEHLSNYLKAEKTDQDDIDEFMSLWHLRHQAIQPSFHAKEANLSLCRVILPLFK